MENEKKIKEKDLEGIAGGSAGSCSHNYTVLREDDAYDPNTNAMDYGRILICSKCGYKLYQAKTKLPLPGMKIDGWVFMDKETYWNNFGLWNKSGPK